MDLLAQTLPQSTNTALVQACMLLLRQVILYAVPRGHKASVTPCADMDSKATSTAAVAEEEEGGGGAVGEWGRRCQDGCRSWCAECCGG